MIVTIRGNGAHAVTAPQPLAQIGKVPLWRRRHASRDRGVKIDQQARHRRLLWPRLRRAIAIASLAHLHHVGRTHAEALGKHPITALSGTALAPGIRGLVGAGGQIKLLSDQQHPLRG
jgi:hypothetical protein